MIRSTGSSFRSAVLRIARLRAGCVTMASIAGRSHAKSMLACPASTSLPMIHMQAPPHTSKWRYQLLTRWIRRRDYVETVWRLCGDAGLPISRARLPIGAGRFLAAWRCSTPPPAAQVVDVCVGLYGLGGRSAEVCHMRARTGGNLRSPAVTRTACNLATRRLTLCLERPPKQYVTLTWPWNPLEDQWLPENRLSDRLALYLRIREWRIQGMLPRRLNSTIQRDR